MEIEIDFNPRPSKMFFISVALNKKETISFDYTTKGHHIIKQVLIEKKKFPKNKKISGSWQTLVFKNCKFIKKYSAKWIDLEKKDWVNNEIWETVWEKPMPDKLQKKLLKLSQFISENYQKKEKTKNKLKELEKIIKSKKQMPDLTLIKEPEEVQMGTETGLEIKFTGSVEGKKLEFKQAFTKKFNNLYTISYKCLEGKCTAYNVFNTMKNNIKFFDSRK